MLRATPAAAPALIDRANRALADLAERIVRLKGWPRRGAALLAGASAALAFAPAHALPLLAAGFSVLVLLIDGSRRKQAFAAGWFFGFGYFIVSLYWLAFSFFVQAEQFAWMAPFAVIGLSAFLGLFTGGAAAVAAALWRPGIQRLLVFAAVYMTFEYARGHVLTGLPWNLPGQALAGTAIGAQTAAWWGVYGLSLIVLTLAVLPARARDGKGAQGLIAMLGGAAILFCVGALRLAGPDPGVREDVLIRIVQPNIPQREKIAGDLWARNFKRHIALSQGDAPAARVYILWPENAAPYLQEYEDALALMSRELPKNATLIAGVVRREEIGGKELYFNSIGVFVETGGERIARAFYDKHHLAPFGEYLPFQGLLRSVGLAQLAPYDEGFAFGSGPQIMSDGGPDFAPLVCYEAIFPGEIYPEGRRPEWIATVTNDAWFGDTAGPRQHLDQARLRAVETGLPMARSANTGVSAMIDAKGRILDRIPLYESGRIDAPLPRPLAATIYTRIGDLGFAILLIGALALGVSPPRRTRGGP